MIDADQLTKFVLASLNEVLIGLEDVDGIGFGLLLCDKDKLGNTAEVIFSGLALHP